MKNGWLHDTLMKLCLIKKMKTATQQKSASTHFCCLLAKVLGNPYLKTNRVILTLYGKHAKIGALRI